MKNDFENPSFELFKEVVHNFGKGHYLVIKYLFSLDAYVILCPTRSKNLERTLFYLTQSVVPKLCNMSIAFLSNTLPGKI